MNYEYDAIVIGLGPAGMAVSIMGSEMGLKICAIESRAIGGECMNLGCIPSKALLSMARARADVGRLAQMALAALPLPDVGEPFRKIHDYIEYINRTKTGKMFEKVKLALGEGAARFIGPHTVAVGERSFTARRIYICVGTRPALPPISGLPDVDILTNENMFQLASVPESMTIIGGGAIGCEMAQAFTRLGCRCAIAHMDPHLLPAGDPDLGNALQAIFEKENIAVYNKRRIREIRKRGDAVALLTEEGDEIVSRRLLVAAGRTPVLDGLALDKAGVAFTKRGITVDKYLRTSRRHIFGVGDCNGHALLTHAAMHQGMLAIMNSMIPGPFKINFKKFAIPWTVFTTPAVSQVGPTGAQLAQAGVRFEEVTARYADYGAAIAENLAEGFVKAYVSPAGRILGARIIGDGSGEMIGEWALAIQKRLRITDIMMLQHSFPTMSFLTKRVAETWMMGRMQSERIRNICRFLFRLNGN